MKRAPHSRVKVKEKGMQRKRPLLNRVCNHRRSLRTAPLAQGYFDRGGFGKETQKTDCKCLQNTALILLLIQIREEAQTN